MATVTCFPHTGGPVTSAAPCLGGGQAGTVTQTEDVGGQTGSALCQETQGSKFISILKVSHLGKKN